MPGDGPVDAGRVDPVRAELVKLEALDGTPGSAALDHGLEQGLLTLVVLVVVLVGVPQDDVSSLVRRTWLTERVSRRNRGEIKIITN